MAGLPFGCLHNMHGRRTRQRLAGRRWAGGGSRQGSVRPAKVSKRRPCVPKRGAGGAAPAGGTACPAVHKTLEGGLGGTTASATKSPLPVPELGGRKGRGSPSAPPLLAKCERVCYSIPMKSAAGPPLFLGACRITYVLGANHRESPCGRGAEGTTQGARPSEEAWDRSECRCKAQALWSGMAPK